MTESQADDLRAEVDLLTARIDDLTRFLVEATTKRDQLRELARELVAMRGHSTACPAWGSADDSAPCFCILAKAKALGIGGEG